MLKLKIVLSCALILQVVWFSGCSSSPKIEDFQGGVHIIFAIQSDSKSELNQDRIEKIKTNIENRLDAFKVKKRIVRLLSSERIAVQIPPVKDPERVIQLISRPAILEFRVVDEKTPIADALKGSVPPGKQILYQQLEKNGKIQKIPFILEPMEPNTGFLLKDAKVYFDSHQQPGVELIFSKSGGRWFEEITGKNIMRRLAIVLDNQVYSAPVIHEKIAGGRAILSGKFTVEEAMDLSIVLRAGSFPVPVKIVETGRITSDNFLADRPE